jgi:putative toxin-antitoxin system antitoxin component (TIGR02293 family)
MALKKYKPNNPILDEVTEAISNYVQLIDNDSSYKSLKKKVLFSDFFEDKMLLIHIIREGLPFKIFNLIKEISPFTEDDWASYLDISKKSLQRYSTDKEYLFKSIHTEKIIELAEVTNFGKQVFDTPDQFYLWLKTPSFIFNNLKPVDLLKDSYGKELVMEELNRIEHGIFA